MSGSVLVCERKEEFCDYVKTEEMYCRNSEPRDMWGNWRLEKYSLLKYKIASNLAKTEEPKKYEINVKKENA